MGLTRKEVRNYPNIQKNPGFACGISRVALPAPGVVLDLWVADPLCFLNPYSILNINGVLWLTCHRCQMKTAGGPPVLFVPSINHIWFSDSLNIVMLGNIVCDFKKKALRSVSVPTRQQTQSPFAQLHEQTICTIVQTDHFKFYHQPPLPVCLQLGSNVTNFWSSLSCLLVVVAHPTIACVFDWPACSIAQTNRRDGLFCAAAPADFFF